MSNFLIKSGLICSLLKVKSRIFTKDKDVTSICSRIGAYEYLKRYVQKLPKNRFPEKPSSLQQRIWVCWLQGADKMPAIVKKCIESIRHFTSPIVCTIIDYNNIAQFIDIPDYISQKHHQKIIPPAHFSDYIRIALLEKYGGIWIDATVLLTDRLPNEIFNSDIFCIRNVPIGKVHAANWFISAKPHNPIIQDMKDCLENYWQHENRLITYSIFHLFWTHVIFRNEENEALWEKVPYFSCDATYILQNEMLDPYDESRLSRIKQMTTIHKLTYKVSQKDNLTNTFYHQIINNNETYL